jgi:hypothetical protein
MNIATWSMESVYGDALSDKLRNGNELQGRLLKKRFHRICGSCASRRGAPASACNNKGAIVFELKKGMFSTSVKAGVLGALAATLLVACGAERAPVETAGPAHLAAASPEVIATNPPTLAGEMPEVVVSAKRGET